MYLARESARPRQTPQWPPQPSNLTSCHATRLTPHVCHVTRVHLTPMSTAQSPHCRNGGFIHLPTFFAPIFFVYVCLFVLFVCERRPRIGFHKRPTVSYYTYTSYCPSGTMSLSFIPPENIVCHLEKIKK